MKKKDFKELISNFFQKIKKNFIKISRGEGNFNIMLYWYGLVPGLVITFFFQRKLDLMRNYYISIPIYVIFAAYFLWHLFVIRKTLKVQPQYRVVKPSKKELYKDKTKEEIEKIKKEKKKETMQKLLLLRAWDSAPNYILIGCFDAYVALTQLQGIFRIIRI